MKIVSLKFSSEVDDLLKAIFTRDGSGFFEGHTEDYLLHLVEYMARKCTKDLSVEFRQERRELAVATYNAIHYSIQLGSDRHPIDDD